VKLPRLRNPEMRILEPGEIKVLAERIDPRYRAMMLTAACAGLRFGEFCALRIERFDALRRTVRVEANLSEVRGEFYFKEPKSDASRRTVSVPSFLVEKLAQHLGMWADESGLLSQPPQVGRFDERTSAAGYGRWR
jgi:integrase